MCFRNVRRQTTGFPSEQWQITILTAGKMTQFIKNSNKHVVSLFCLLVLHHILRIIIPMTHFKMTNNVSHNTTNCMYRNFYFSSTKLLNASIHIFTKLAVCFVYKNCDGGEHDFHSLIPNTYYI